MFKNYELRERSGKNRKGCSAEIHSFAKKDELYPYRKLGVEWQNSRKGAPHLILSRGMV